MSRAHMSRAHEQHGARIQPGKHARITSTQVSRRLLLRNRCFAPEMSDLEDGYGGEVRPEVRAQHPGQIPARDCAGR
jgi:hypothetical protein